ncbi:MAG: DsrE family protein [Candidatus Magnetoovum sp. WYHC-5]|nr:DsrE family protein [Candidatus Magnetoovum sp. WYHC-5]
MSRLKVLFHVNEEEKWNTALANVTNLFKDVGDGAADVVVLANGPSVKAYVDSGKLKVMEELARKGALFLACRNSLKKMCEEQTGACVNESTLPDFVKVVPAGVTEIIKRQMDGFAYIKP